MGCPNSRQVWCLLPLALLVPFTGPSKGHFCLADMMGIMGQKCALHQYLLPLPHFHFHLENPSGNLGGGPQEQPGTARCLRVAVGQEEGAPATAQQCPSLGTEPARKVAKCHSSRTFLVHRHEGASVCTCKCTLYYAFIPPHSCVFIGCDFTVSFDICFM